MIVSLDFSFHSTYDRSRILYIYDMIWYIIYIVVDKFTNVAIEKDYHHHHLNSVRRLMQRWGPSSWIWGNCPIVQPSNTWKSLVTDNRPHHHHHHNNNNNNHNLCLVQIQTFIIKTFLGNFGSLELLKKRSCPTLQNQKSRYRWEAFSENWPQQCNSN